MTMLDHIQQPSLPMPWSVMSAGETSAPEAIVIRNGAWRKRTIFEATIVLLQHPKLGPVLFDTSYTPRFHEETKRWPSIFYALVTPVRLSPLGSIVEQLASRGIAASDVRHVFISHFHADHICGLRDFPAATFYCSHEAWKAVLPLRGFNAVRQGFLAGLVPPDFEQRVRFVGHGSDVFGDGSVRALGLPGHAKGQTGLWFRDLQNRDVLLVADACWLSAAFRGNLPPHVVTKGLHDWDVYVRTLAQLHAIFQERPEAVIVPCHCPETAARILPP